MLSQIKSFVVLCFGVSLCNLGGVGTLTAQENEQGNVIRIGPDRRAREENQRRPVRQQPVVVSQYWIGIEAGEASLALRSQLRLKEDQGLLINRVMNDSPADEGELKVYDVITRVNGKSVRTVPQLSEHVGEQGERKGRLAVEIIREGLPKTVFVTPAERPIEETREFPIWGRGFDNDRFGGHGNFEQRILADGIAISIQQSGDRPPKISVQRGNESWEIEGDDPEALAELPDDIRKEVEAILERGANRRNGRFDIPMMIPQPADINEQMEEIQREMDRLRQEMLRGGIERQPLQPNVEPDPAPQAEPSEIELPAEAE